MRIAIVGAGIGGLTLAAALQRQGIKAQVYERDESVAARQQGYAISLKESTGLRVLRELGLDAETRRVARPVADFTFLTAAGKPLLHLRANPDSPEYTVGVPREFLRACLLEVVPTEWITWGAQCTGVTQRDGGLLVEFEGAAPIEADLVVAADGVRSIFRKTLVMDPLRYLGLTAVGGIVGADIDHPLLAGGASMTLGMGSSIFVIPRKASWIVWTGSPQELGG